MKNKKYIKLSDIQKEIFKSYDVITKNLDKNRIENDKIQLLEKLSFFIETKTQVPCTKKILKDLVKLKFICLNMKAPPLKEVTDEKIIKAVKDKKETVIIGKTLSAVELLEDFIKFVCNEKGHKIGVDDYLITKYVYEVFYPLGYCVDR